MPASPTRGRVLPAGARHLRRGTRTLSSASLRPVRIGHRRRTAPGPSVQLWAIRRRLHCHPSRGLRHHLAGRRSRSTCRARRPTIGAWPPLSRYKGQRSHRCRGTSVGFLVPIGEDWGQEVSLDSLRPTPRTTHPTGGRLVQAVNLDVDPVVRAAARRGRGRDATASARVLLVDPSDLHPTTERA